MRSKKLIIIIGSILLAFACCITIVGMKSLWQSLEWSVFGGGFPKFSIMVAIIFLATTCLAFRSNETASNILISIGSVIGNWFFIYIIYFGIVYNYLAMATGIYPSILLMLMSFFIGIVGAVGYFVIFSHFKVKIRLWPAYLIISVFGPIVIMISAYLQPIQLFDHNIIDKGEIVKSEMEGYYYDIDNNKKNAAKGIYPIRSKFWILRDNDSNIIAHSFSPGISTSLGRELVRGTPDDAEEFITYLKTRTKLGWLYSLMDTPIVSSTTPTPKQDTKVVFEPKTFTMEDADENCHITVAYWNDIDLQVGDMIRVKVWDAKGINKNVQFGIYQTSTYCKMFKNETEFPVEEIPTETGGKFIVALDTDIDNIAIVSITRKIS